MTMHEFPLGSPSEYPGSEQVVETLSCLWEHVQRLHQLMERMTAAIIRLEHSQDPKPPSNDKVTDRLDQNPLASLGEYPKNEHVVKALRYLWEHVRMLQERMETAISLLMAVADSVPNVSDSTVSESVAQQRHIHGGGPKE